MPDFKKQITINHSAEQMFLLVSDIEKYPEFVPLCESLTIRHSKIKNDMTLLIADMGVGYKAVRENFTTQVLLKTAELKIDVTYIDGPFKHLHNEWDFIPINDVSCTVHFAIDYEFKSKMLGMLMGTMFDKAFHKTTDAFAKRADVVYG